MRRFPGVLGINAGTESVRAVLFDKKGNALGEGCAAYRTHFVRSGWVEQQPQEVWEVLLIAMKRVAVSVPTAEFVSCCLVSTAVALVTVDRDGNAF
jgi:sugar (pentulose or hexulose) kinase